MIYIFAKITKNNNLSKKLVKKSVCVIFSNASCPELALPIMYLEDWQMLVLVPVSSITTM